MIKKEAEGTRKLPKDARRAAYWDNRATGDPGWGKKFELGKVF